METMSYFTMVMQCFLVHSGHWAHFDKFCKKCFGVVSIFNSRYRFKVWTCVLVVFGKLCLHNSPSNDSFQMLKRIFLQPVIYFFFLHSVPLTHYRIWLSLSGRNSLVWHTCCRSSADFITVELSISLISNNRSSRGENLAPVLTWKSDNIFIFFFILFKQCLKRMTQLAINNYSTLWSSN